MKNQEVHNKFYGMLYHQFWSEYISINSKTKGFTREEIEWALLETQYRYFGEYSFTDQQSMAVDILEWAAKEYLKSD